MPEAAEVELFRRSLQQAVGQEIRRVTLADESIADVFASASGQVVTAVRRLGKRLGLDLSDETTIVIHPCLTGAIEPHVGHAGGDHLRAVFEFTSISFNFLDRRRLGRLGRIASAELALS